MWHDVTRKGLDRGRDREADVEYWCSIGPGLTRSGPLKDWINVTFAAAGATSMTFMPRQCRSLISMPKPRTHNSMWPLDLSDCPGHSYRTNAPAGLCLLSSRDPICPIALTPHMRLLSSYQWPIGGSAAAAVSGEMIRADAPASAALTLRRHTARPTRRRNR